MTKEEERALMTETILAMHGLSVDQVGTYQMFEKKKEKIRDILSICSDQDEDLSRQMGTLDLILEKKQYLQFYLIEDENGRLGFPNGCDLSDPESYETLLIFDELAGCLEEIARISLQKKSETQLDESLLRILGLLNTAPYEKLNDLLNALLRITRITDQ